jgi:large subunit ribosomal protein L21
VTIGTPTVDDATVQARVVDHVKGDKVIVFKKKRRKRYRVKRGHRQQYTQIQIESLRVNGAAPEDVEEASTGEDEPTGEDASSEDEASDAADTTDEAEASDAEEADAETDDETKATDDA